MSVVQVGQDLIDEGHPQSEEFRALIEDLLQRWQELKDAVEARNQRLKLSEVAQQVSTFLLLLCHEFREAKADKAEKDLESAFKFLLKTKTGLWDFY